MAGSISASVPRTLHQDMEMQDRKIVGKCEGSVVAKDLTNPHHQNCIEGEAMGGEATSLSITSVSTSCDVPPLTPSKTQVVHCSSRSFSLRHLMHFILNIVLCILPVLIYCTMYTAFFQMFFHLNFFLTQSLLSAYPFSSALPLPLVPYLEEGCNCSHSCR